MALGSTGICTIQVSKSNLGKYSQGSISEIVSPCSLTKRQPLLTIPNDGCCRNSAICAANLSGKKKSS